MDKAGKNTESVTPSYDTGKCRKIYKNSKVYLVLFSLLGILQGSYFTYFVGIFPTLEKRFHFDTSITSIILIADNLSPLLFGVLVGHYGKIAHKPRVLTYGMMITVVSCFLCCIPYLISSPDTSFLIKNSSNTEVSNYLICYTTHSNQTCNTHQLSESYLAIIILFVANFFNGCGSTIYYTIGTTYLDDNVKKNKSPIYLGTFFGLKMIGPFLGFMLSSFCLKIYEDPYGYPEFKEKDLRWIGCWWLGFLILGISITIVSIPISFFPERIKNYPSVRENSIHSARSFMSDLMMSLIKIVRNPILMFHALGIAFQINGVYGYFTFMTKYMQDQYKQTASLASLFSGTTKLVTLIAGVFFGSVVIQKCQPSPKYLTTYMVTVSVVVIIGFSSVFFLGCTAPDTIGLVNKATSLQECSEECGCSINKFSPICANNTAEFFSPCFAGCLDITAQNGTKVFSNCSCANTLYLNASVKEGMCPTNCDKFLPYFVIITIISVLVSTTRVGKVLVTLRCNEDDDKALALSAVEFVISLLATIPYPLIYGHVIDRSCILWEENCGKRGNCQYYDGDLFRNSLHALSLAFVVAGFFCEAVVLQLSGRLKNFYGFDERHNEKCIDEDNVDFMLK